MNFNEFFRENMTYDDIKSDRKRESFTFYSDSTIFEIYS